MFKNDQILMLVVAFLLGYFMKQMCSGVVEGLDCGKQTDCGSRASNKCDSNMFSPSFCKCNKGTTYVKGEGCCGKQIGNVPGVGPCCKGQLARLSGHGDDAHTACFTDRARRKEGRFTLKGSNVQCSKDSECNAMPNMTCVKMFGATKGLCQLKKG